jgi:ABC-type antimicrobial peptide transport system permease subunit
VGIGVTLGLAGALLTARFLDSLLFNGGGKDGGKDPLTYAGVMAGVIAVGLLANLAPARRAALLNPVQTLRSE